MSTKSKIFLLVMGFFVLSCNLQKNTVRPVFYEDIIKGFEDNWLTHGGGYFSQRHSSLSQINRESVYRLNLKWKLKIGSSENIRGTPLVHNGVMYATSANGVFALDATNGKKLWNWEVLNKKRGGQNRGVALLENRVFFITSDCKLTSFNKDTGELLWQNKYVHEKGYYCTLAPLAIKDRIVVGVSIDNEATTRGFIAMFDAKNGKEIWRFWTTPSVEELGAATWVSGSYDSESDTIYWTTGSPLPNFEGEKNRPGDNLYSNCLLALDAKTGKLKWYFQFTPHDSHHWDSNEVLILVDEVWDKEKRKLILQANRNGFFYVLDRTSGRFLFGRSFVKKVTWTDGLNQSGRPIVSVGTSEHLRIGRAGDCPSLLGATNWMSPSYNPITKLFYVVTNDGCEQEAGQTRIKALDPFSGKTKLEYQLSGTQFITAGIISTGGGLVFTGDRNKNFFALDADTGQNLWKHLLGYYIFASPISYTVNGFQYVAVSAGEMIY